MRQCKRLLDDLDQGIRDHLDRHMQDKFERGMPSGRSGRNMAAGSVVWREQPPQDARFGLRTLWRAGD